MTNNDILIAIKTSLLSNRFHGVYIYGDTSCGKTYDVEQAFKVLNKDPTYINTHITPLALYKLLYTHREGIIVFDDLDKYNDTMIAILKGALWAIDGRRQIAWHTSSSALDEENIPNEFEFKGKIVLTCNNDRTHSIIEPLLARCFVVNKVMTKDDLITISKNLFDEYGVDKHAEFVKKYVNVYTDGLHLRNILKYCEYHSRGFTEQANSVFKINEIYEFFEVSQVSSVSALQIMFSKRFGLSRATFFRYWKNFKILKEAGW